MDIKKPSLPWRYALTPLDLKKVKYIVLHHIKASRATIQDVDTWHKQNGWNGVGYNYYVRKDGTVYEGRGLNKGAHWSGYNDVSIGIACEGNYETEYGMPQVQFESLLGVIKHVKSLLPNPVKVVGHKDLNQTECPGKNFSMENTLKYSADPVPAESIDWKKKYEDLLNQYYGMRKAILGITNKYI